MRSVGEKGGEHRVREMGARGEERRGGERWEREERRRKKEKKERAFLKGTAKHSKECATTLNSTTLSQPL